ncbi:MAG TPA: hypothetical protein VEL76_40500 [Gemmataceae bacterium]|nr:hypothetical protein [Gemmataceae bacterium]
MTLVEAQQAFAGLPVAGQARFLGILAAEATVWARSAYPEMLPDPTQVIARLRQSNEFQHRIANQLAHLLANDTARYPDDVFVAILFDYAQGAGCEDELTRTFQELHAAYLRKTSKENGRRVAEQQATSTKT